MTDNGMEINMLKYLKLLETILKMVKSIQQNTKYITIK